jgi:hypothetical protein
MRNRKQYVVAQIDAECSAEMSLDEEESMVGDEPAAYTRAYR